MARGNGRRTHSLSERTARAVVALTLLMPLLALGQTAIHIQGSAPDEVGKQFMFELKEALRRSAGFSLADRPQDARFFLRVVTLDPDDAAAAGHQTVYSAVLTLQTFHDTPVDMYVVNYVGICGRGRVAACARSMLAELDEETTTVRRQIKDAIDSTRKK